MSKEETELKAIIENSVHQEIDFLYQKNGRSIPSKSRQDVAINIRNSILRSVQSQLQAKEEEIEELKEKFVDMGDLEKEARAKIEELTKEGKLVFQNNSDLLTLNSKQTQLLKEMGEALETSIKMFSKIKNGVFVFNNYQVFQKLEEALSKLKQQLKEE